MKTCVSCAKLIENAKVARKKGLPPRKPIISGFRFSRRPRTDAPCACINVDNWDNDHICRDTPACKHYYPRWRRNLEIFRSCVAYYVELEVRNLIIRPIGRLRKPVKLNWVRDWGGLVPECPHCGEMPYSLTECVFCGQKFLEEDHD